MAITTQNTAVSGWATVVGLAKETTAGTAVAPTIYLPFDSASFNVANKVITRTPVRRSKAEALPGFGLVSSSGSIDMKVDPDSIGLMLGLVMGSDTVTGTAPTGYTHTMKLAAQSTATISADYGKNSVAQYTGCKMNGVDISCKPGMDLDAKFGFDGVTVSLLAAQSLTPTYSTNPFYEWSFIQSSTLGGTAIDIADFALSLKHSNKPMYTSTSGRFARAINEMGSSVSGSITLPYKDDTINAILWGGTSGPVAGNATGKTLVIPFTHPNFAVGAVNYTIVFTLNNLVISEAPIPVSAKNEVMQQVKFTAAESTPGAGDAITISMLNTATAAYV